MIMTGLINSILIFYFSGCTDQLCVSNYYLNTDNEKKLPSSFQAKPATCLLSELRLSFLIRPFPLYKSNDSDCFWKGSFLFYLISCISTRHFNIWENKIWKLNWSHMDTRNKLVMPPSFCPNSSFLKKTKKVTEEYSQLANRKFKFDFPNDQVSELIINIEIVWST